MTPDVALEGPLWLADLATPQRVISGNVAVFAARNDGGETGERRFLFQMEAGGIFSPVPSGPTQDGGVWQLLAVPLGDCRVTTCSDAEDSATQEWFAKLALAAGLESWNADGFFHALTEAEERREAEELDRFEKRMRIDQDLALEAMGTLASVTKRGASLPASPVARDFLLRAIGAVAAAQGIAVRPPPAGEDADSLRAVAERSQFRTRKVLLSGAWWERENGPIFARLKDGRVPVALLPVKPSAGSRSRYVLYDPVDDSRHPVDGEAASFIHPIASTFYRPFPEHASTWNLLRFAFSFYRRDLWAIVLTGVAAIVLGMVAPQATAILINQAIPDADRNMVWQVALAMAAASIGAMLFLLAQSAATIRAQGAAFIALQTGVWDHLMKLPPAFFRAFTAGGLRVRADTVTRIQQLLTADALRTMFAGATSFFMLLLMFYYNAALGALALLCCLVVLLSGWLGARSLLRLQSRWQELEEALSGLVLQIIGAVPKIRVAGAERRAFAYWTREYSKKQSVTAQIQAVKDRVRLVNTTAPVLASVVSFLYLLGLPAGTLPLGTFLAYNAALTLFMVALTNASDTFMGLVLIGSLWQRTQTILRALPEVDSSKVHPGKLQGKIVVESVTFRYRTDGPLILDQASIYAEPGECIALTGPSGSGKSTLLNLLLRFEVPHSGAIYLDGHELSSLDISAVRRQIGVVTQNGKIMSGSIYQNICCSGLNTMDEAWEAARSAGLAADIEQMPMGMHTVISEGGTNISGGQRQRLLIARALVLKPRILIFDEATSALDNRTQAIVTESLNRLNATRILVAHRLSTIQQADRIYVIEGGRVVQQGKYFELASQPGLFARLANRQT